MESQKSKINNQKATQPFPIIIEQILQLAHKIAEEAEVFWISSEETPVNFHANHLKAIQSKQSTSVSLRVIKNGRLGY